MAKNDLILCQHCSKEVIAQAWNQRYCSIECRDEANNYENRYTVWRASIKICPLCDKTYLPNTANCKICPAPACKKLYRTVMQRERRKYYREIGSTPVAVRLCKKCKSEIPANTPLHKKYCSNSCRVAFCKAKKQN